ncbi:Uncharacterised protein [Acinetobacter baumannii]|nr:Uncharacterised protein [Acinetobacter baumannii]
MAYGKALAFPNQNIGKAIDASVQMEAILLHAIHE